MGEPTNKTQYSDYIIFIDESGDHGLRNLDTDYPIFVLVFVIIKKSDYIEKIIPDFEKLKFQYFGHDQVIFHEHDIRKESGIFSLLRRDAQLRKNFLNDLSELISNCHFEFFASIIDKDKLQKKYLAPHNPYEIAMLFCVEHSLELLIKNQQQSKQIHLIIEGRGSRENRELELEFRRICDNQSKLHSTKDFRQINFELICADKKSNSTGLQIADLIARPIGLSKLRPDQNNRAYEIIRKKGLIKKFP